MIGPSPCCVKFKKCSSQSGRNSLTMVESSTPDFSAIRGLVLDMDGVLWHGNKPLPGLDRFAQLVQRCELKYVLATNNPSKSPDEFARKAIRMGFPVQPNQVITAGTATIDYMHRSYPTGTRIYTVCSDVLREQLDQAGFVLARDNVEAVVVSMDPEISYEKLKRGTLLIRGGAKFIATNPDPFYPSDEGFLPGSGTLVEAFAASTARRPVVMGKPEPFMYKLASTRMGLKPSEIVCVGDRLDTDVLGGLGAGMKTILVLSGVATEADLERSSVKPTWVSKSLTALTQALWEAYEG